tara:strand:- start:1648 stop:1965 length:318 start_codon:yes stop_codon:yes gene_type:complete
MPSIKTLIRFLEAVVLDLKSIPGVFMSKKRNAKWHLNYICPSCSNWRKSFRDAERKGNNCLWEDSWKDGDYDFPRNFGVLNWIKYYLGVKTNLGKYLFLKDKIKK